MTDRVDGDERGTDHASRRAAPPGGDGGSADAPFGPPDLAALARDWITLWQSELAALAADREAQETWRAALALWAGAANTILNSMKRPGQGSAAPAHERPDESARPEPETRPATAAAAPDPRDAEIERLARHIAALEARLGELEGGGSPRRPRKRKS